jgi:glycosyltransferase involved in cell wall biosynthesis
MTQRIVFISIFQKDFGGGEGRVAHELAAQFAQQYNTALICPGAQNRLFRDENGLVTFNIQSAGENHFLMPLLSPQNIRSIFDFLDGFAPDIVHAHDPALLGVIGQLWANQHNVPFVYTCHIAPGKVLEFGASDVLRIPVGSMTESIIEDYLLTFYNNCSAVVALNQIIAESIQEFGSTARLFTIPNGRYLQRYSACKNASTSAVQKKLVFVGYITPRKNQIYLLQMMKHLPKNYQLTLVGEFLSPAYEKELRTYVAQNGLTNVIFAGEVNHSEIPAYLEQAHVEVSASKMEVQSLVIIESLASGTPVVGLSNETIEELVDEETGKRLPKDTPHEVFARCVEEMCNLPQPVYDRMCEAARLRVSGLDWKNVMETTVKVYDQLIAEKDKNQPVDQGRLLQIIARIPPGMVRDALLDKVVTPLYTSIRKQQRVTSKSRFFAGVTAVGSIFIYMAMKGPVMLIKKLRLLQKSRRKKL